MFSWRPQRHGGGNGDLRLAMIAQTSAFLSWALAQERSLPRIPVRRVNDGGFARMLAQPGAGALIGRLWGRLLESDWLDH